MQDWSGPVKISFKVFCNPPASKARTEVANLAERKNLPTPVYGVKEFFFDRIL